MLHTNDPKTKNLSDEKKQNNYKRLTLLEIAENLKIANQLLYEDTSLGYTCDQLHEQVFTLEDAAYREIKPRLSSIMKWYLNVAELSVEELYNKLNDPVNIPESRKLTRILNGDFNTFMEFEKNSIRGIVDAIEYPIEELLEITHTLDSLAAESKSIATSILPATPIVNNQVSLEQANNLKTNIKLLLNRHEITVGHLEKIAGLSYFEIDKFLNNEPVNIFNVVDPLAKICGCSAEELMAKRIEVALSEARQVATKSNNYLHREYVKHLEAMIKPPMVTSGENKNDDFLVKELDGEKLEHVLEQARKNSSLSKNPLHQEYVKFLEEKAKSKPTITAPKTKSPGSRSTLKTILTTVASITALEAEATPFSGPETNLNHYPTEIPANNEVVNVEAKLENFSGPEVESIHQSPLPPSNSSRNKGYPGAITDRPFKKSRNPSPRGSRPKLLRVTPLAGTHQSITEKLSSAITNGVKHLVKSAVPFVTGEIAAEGVHQVAEQLAPNNSSLKVSAPIVSGGVVTGGVAGALFGSPAVGPFAAMETAFRTSKAIEQHLSDKEAASVRLGARAIQLAADVLAAPPQMAFGALESVIIPEPALPQTGIPAFDVSLDVLYKTATLPARAVMSVCDGSAIVGLYNGAKKSTDAMVEHGSKLVTAAVELATENLDSSVPLAYNSCPYLLSSDHPDSPGQGFSFVNASQVSEVKDTFTKPEPEFKITRFEEPLLEQAGRNNNVDFESTLRFNSDGVLDCTKVFATSTVTAKVSSRNESRSDSSSIVVSPYSIFNSNSSIKATYASKTNAISYSSPGAQVGVGSQSSRGLPRVVITEAGGCTGVFDDNLRKRIENRGYQCDRVTGVCKHRSLI